MFNYIARINHKFHIGEAHPIWGGSPTPKGINRMKIFAAANRVIKRINNGTICSIDVRKKIHSL